METGLISIALLLKNELPIKLEQNQAIKNLQINIELFHLILLKIVITVLYAIEYQTDFC